MLELLSDFQITIPDRHHFGRKSPVVILTSNRTHAKSTTLKRRCLYHWIDYPSFEKERDIVLAKVPDAPEKLALQITAFIQELRTADLYKIPASPKPSTGQRRWLHSVTELDASVVNDTLGVILKYKDDVAG